MLKRIISLVLTVVCVLPLCRISSGADEIQTHTVTWIAGEGAVFSNAFDITNIHESTFEHGHVIVAKDLPNYIPHLPETDKYHYEWQGALGTKVTDDMTFELKLVSNYEGYVTVMWRSSIKPWHQICHGTDDWTETGFFCEADIYPKGHTITAEDTAKHNPYRKMQFNENDYDYHYEWSDAAGTVLTDDCTVFHYDCVADDPLMAAVVWYNPFSAVSMRPRSYDSNMDYTYLTGCVELFPKGHVIEQTDVPELTDTVDHVIYAYNWNEAIGKAAENGDYFILDRERLEYLTVTLYVDGKVAKTYEKLAAGTRIVLPVTLEGHEEKHIYRWDESPEQTSLLQCKAGEEIEVSFDISLEAQYVLWGDINYDNEVNTRDAVVILKKIAEGREFRVMEMYAADIDQSGTVNTRDAYLTLQIAASN